MLLCRRSVLLHRGMGELQSPMSCLIICLVAITFYCSDYTTAHPAYARQIFCLAEYLAISNVDEARELRSAGIHLPILQLGLTPVDQIQVILDNRSAGQSCS